MATQTTEHTEHDETTEHPETDPEKGTGTGGDNSESTPSGDTTNGTDDATTETGEGTGDADGAQTEDGQDWQAKAQLYKVHMRRNEKDLKAARAEKQRLEEELAKLQKADTDTGTAPKDKANATSTSKEQDQPDPVSERMEQLATELAQVRELSETLRQENSQAAHSKLVAEVAADKGLSAAQASRLRGDTREDLETDAEEVIELFGLNQKRTPSPAPKPKEKRPVQGGSSNPDTSGDGRNRDDILAAVLNTQGRRRS